jgi:hypothetical protein
MKKDLVCQAFFTAKLLRFLPVNHIDIKTLVLYSTKSNRGRRRSHQYAFGDGDQQRRILGSAGQWFFSGSLALTSRMSKEWRLFHNFFCPSVKLIAKERIGSKTIKHHDPPKTPYQRIMESSHIQESVKLSLSKQLETLNTFLLRKTMDKKMKKIFSINNKPR